MIIYKNEYYYIPKLTIDKVENEILIYDENQNKIMIFNITASLIFDFLYNENNIIDTYYISIEEIANEIIEIFDKKTVDYIEFCKDISETIDNFIKFGILKYCNEKES